MLVMIALLFHYLLPKWLPVKLCSSFIVHTGFVCTREEASEERDRERERQSACVHVA